MLSRLKADGTSSGRVMGDSNKLAASRRDVPVMRPLFVFFSFDIATGLLVAAALDKVNAAISYFCRGRPAVSSIALAQPEKGGTAP